MPPLSFILIGSGWRSLFYIRIAKRCPEQFILKYMLCRTEEKAEYMRHTYNIPVTTSPEVCERSGADFAVMAVNKSSLFEETKKWSQKGFAVLCETPAAVKTEDLKQLWELVQNGAKIQIAEQYHRYPFIAAGLKAIEEGKIGEPYAVHLSIAHDYHGMSLIRRMLKAGKLEALSGARYTFPVTETDSRNGAITDGSVNPKDRTVVTL